jgi:hypothetical protein
MIFRGTTMKNEEFLTYARRMRAGGIPLYIEEDDEDGPRARGEGLLIETVGGAIENMVFDIPPYQAGYIISIRVTVNLSRFAVSDFGLDLPWEDHFFRFLQDPLECGIHPPLYTFPGRHGDEYMRDLGLNHYADATRMLPRGQSIDGCLFAVGTSMPNRIEHGEMAPAIVTVFDQFNCRYPAPVTLWALRSEKVNPKPRMKPPRKVLFDESDLDIGHTLVSDGGVSVGVQRQKSKKLSTEAPDVD